jgi:predicted O-methyltransferase YrrM
MIEIPAIPGWLTPGEANVLVGLALGGVVLEYGSYLGKSTVVMARVAKFVYTLDWHGYGNLPDFNTKTLPDFLKNLEDHGVRDKVAVLLGGFDQFAPILGKGVFDGAYIDGDHSYEATLRAARLFAPAVKHGGYMAFHDYLNPNAPGVKQAVDEWVGRGGHKTEEVVNEFSPDAGLITGMALVRLKG